jgi:hypothetical protein
MTLKKVNIPAIAFGIFILVVLAKKFLFGTSGEPEKKTAAAAPVEKGSGLADIASQSEVGQLFSTLDWTVTTPGKAVAELFGGSGWANWLLWSAVVVLIILVVRSFFKTKGDNNFGWSILVFIWVVIISIGLYATITNHTSQQETTHAPVDFRMAPIGKTEDVRMGMNTVVISKLRMADINKDGDVYLMACPEVMWPGKSPFTPQFIVVAGAYTLQNHIALTEESKLEIMKYGIGSINVRFTLMAERTMPCRNLILPGSKS